MTVAMAEEPEEPNLDGPAEVERVTKALRMRALGASYEAIAEQCGYYDKSTAYNSIMRALKARRAEQVDELRAVENDRLDIGQTTVAQIMTDSEQPPAVRLRAVDSMVRLSARRARMNGMDAPVEVAISSGAQALLADALAELREVLFGDEDIDAEDADIVEEPDGEPDPGT